MSDEQLNGRELSEAVAVRVFGEARPPLPKTCSPKEQYPSPKRAWLHRHKPTGECDWVPRFFAERVEYAMEVLERFPVWNINKTDHPDFADRPYSVAISIHESEHSSRLKTFEVQAARVETGICRAALKAVEKKG